MKNKKNINPSNIATPLGAYSHGVKWGDLVFVSGELPLDKKTGEPLNTDSIQEQTRTVLQSVQSVLEEADSSINDVLKTTVYLASLDDYKEMNKIYDEYFEDIRPARATIQVAGLVGDVKVEIDAIAVVTK